MKQVAFRWIDKYLINVKLHENFLVLFFTAVLAVVVMGVCFVDAASSQRTVEAQKQVDVIAKLASATQLSASDLAPLLQNTAINIGRNTDISAQVSGLDYSLSYVDDTSFLTGLGLWHITAISLSLLLMFVCSYYVNTFIGGSLFDIYGALRRLAEGDLASRIGYTPARNEFNLIARTVDRVTEREHLLVKTTQEAVALIQQISAQLRVRSDENTQLASVQQDRIDSLASATEEMAVSIREVASHAQESSTQISRATEKTTQGQAQIKKTLVEINQLAGEVRGTSVAVAELDSSATEIGEVIATINAISDQTNLLALNAAIEAARAGEQGRGFSVVADEVRTLAGRTQAATVEIQKIIETLQTNSRGVMNVMAKTVKEAESSEQLMTSASQNINEIAEQNQHISDRSLEIAAAAEEQGAVADNIANDVDSVRSSSIQVMELVNMTAKEIESLSRQADVLEELMKDLIV
ncbi:MULTISPECIES: methyl-accepting chemotaxis protein [unclassified Shewanella]|uniref:methyl-accepting chemotaxis protein n=1 Tax=unclassified Shewanella TaxID=196818 RepID=UPI00137BE4A3|nr:methyl-accepting chemotaxis protein [Shewanella sp. Arc9-LZ]MBO1897947.1 methyl-accepting chemotaxis protein [Shewanella sp. BF02_Schw]QHS15207.1 methyl-accepting chemotaxis protein [Shewanella sp. Arc9-LZ]